MPQLSVSHQYFVFASLHEYIRSIEWNYVFPLNKVGIDVGTIFTQIGKTMGKRSV